jgi:hypothetical protein
MSLTYSLNGNDEPELIIGSPSIQISNNGYQGPPPPPSDRNDVLLQSCASIGIKTLKIPSRRLFMLPSGEYFFSKVHSPIIRDREG